MKIAFKKTVKNIKTALPIVAGVLMLFSLLNPLLEGFYLKIFTGNYLIDPLIGAVAGSFSFGIPIVSYVTGGELLKSGVSLLAVAAFVLTWATVGIAMLPLEISIFGKKFAIVRNSLNFVSSVAIAILTVLTINFFK